MINFSQIYEGWRNKLVPPRELRQVIHDVSEERLDACSNCEHHSKNHDTPLRPDAHCVHCGCNLDAKSKCLSCECPIGKWLKVINDHTDNEQFFKDAYEQK